MLVEMVKVHAGGTMAEPKPPDSGFSPSPVVSNANLMLIENDIIHPRGGTEYVAMSMEDS